MCIRDRLKEVVKALSEATNYLAFVLGPEYETTTIDAIHLLPVTMDKALLVIVSDMGFVENCLIAVSYTHLPYTFLTLQASRKSSMR